MSLVEEVEDAPLVGVEGDVFYGRLLPRHLYISVIAALRVAERLVAVGFPDMPEDCPYCVLGRGGIHDEACEWLALRDALKGEHP